MVFDRAYDWSSALRQLRHAGNRVMPQIDLCQPRLAGP